VSQETGRKTLYQLVRWWVEERGNAHHSRSVGKASSRQGFGLIGGAAPPGAEIPLPSHRFIVRNPQSRRAGAVARCFRLSSD
jgi:hypothetical protein